MKGPAMPDSNSAEEALREALAASRESLRACVKINDHQGIIKASRCVGDLSARYSRLVLGEEFDALPNEHLEQVYKALIKVLEDPDSNRRIQAAASLRACLSKRQTDPDTGGL